MKRPEVVEQIKQQLQHVSPDAIVFLYGSEARGSSRPDSDIDLLILIDKVQIPVEEEKKIIGVFKSIVTNKRYRYKSNHSPKKSMGKSSFNNPFLSEYHKRRSAVMKKKLSIETREALAAHRLQRANDTVNEQQTP